MHTRITWFKMASLAVAATALVACGEGSSNAPKVDSNGKHPANWAAQHGSIASTSSSSCTECHGADLAGGITRVGCFSTSQTAYNGFACHATNPLVNTGCNSCHGIPPNGSAAPNRASAHAVHLALTGVTCASCHAGAGSGTANHAKTTATGGIAGATVSFTENLKAKTISTTYGFDPATGSCSGIICHGGQTTPSWRTGSIEVANDCLSCHELGSAPVPQNTVPTPQHNSFYSGNISFNGGLSQVNLHRLHIGLIDSATACASCHNTVPLSAQHFVGLTTLALEGTAASTIGGGSTLITGYTPSSASAPSGTCTTVCHAVRNWIN